MATNPNSQTEDLRVNSAAPDESRVSYPGRSETRATAGGTSEYQRNPNQQKSAEGIVL